VKVLVDTHCWLWFLMTPERLCAAAVDALADASNEVYVSAAVAWEIVVKHGLGKLPLPLPAAQYVSERLAAVGHRPLAIAVEHAVALADLPPHHKDPFDRILVAQAQVEKLTLVTADDKIKAYAVPILWGAR
jgi:PIN domain nuclease of toxin-antitoxin system